MAIDKTNSTPKLALVPGSKARYEISLVRQMIEGTLTGNEFKDRVRAKAKLAVVGKITKQ